ncbi:hypothetical protein VHEMI06909 [[Torrubiella] hemipterigena]|uniref:Uncharacterized protein n=1 Tax=[Torrubiella] hemipterigena TaxID=1531966 RepID=A0A0A1T8U6_9HYPO|nr:hypothetical protein VHEMI06909 [[Torrubiella] hemipterigena]
MSYSGSTRGDTNIWFYIKQGCYTNEYGFNEYKDGDITEDLKYCGQIPMDIYREPAQVRYLSECKASPYTTDEDVQFYGRDQNITVTCSTKGQELLENDNWYKTVDDCFVRETDLWSPPDRRDLPDCGPRFPVDSQTKRHSLSRRYLICSLVGDEYAPCYTCPKTTCGVTKTYEFNDTVISQCHTDTTTTLPNGTIQEDRWVLTTDWCYVNQTRFWDYPASYSMYTIPVVKTGYQLMIQLGNTNPLALTTTSPIATPGKAMNENHHIFMSCIQGDYLTE